MSDTHRQATEFLEQQLAIEKPNIDPDLRRSLASIGAHLAERGIVAAKAPPAISPASAPAKILQFPLPFGDDTRAASNPLARCALFAPVKERKFFREYVSVGTFNGALLEFAGEQLSQDDHDTLLQFFRMALHKLYGADVVQAVNAGLGRHTHQESPILRSPYMPPAALNTRLANEHPPCFLAS
jgi:hypothetical protein